MSLVTTETFSDPFLADVYDDILRTLEKEQPPFVVTTEEYYREDLDSLGPIADWFRFMLEHYDLWYTVEATPYSFRIFARRDRVYDQPPPPTPTSPKTAPGPTPSAR